MKTIVDEFNATVGADYQLRFKIPTLPEQERMRQIHRDLSEGEKSKRKKHEKQLQDLFKAHEAGDFDIGALPPELIEKMKLLFASPEEGKEPHNGA